MPVIFQQVIHSQDLIRNPNVFYLFGDNVKRTGYGGQAEACRGRKNALGVRTKFAPNMTSEAFFTDNEYEHLIKMIDQDLAPAFEKVSRGGIVVIPLAGLGTGRARLAETAPRVFKHLSDRLKLLAEL